jgi:oligosaccharide repeat unit polymerase
MNYRFLMSSFKHEARFILGAVLMYLFYVNTLTFELIMVPFVNLFLVLYFLSTKYSQAFIYKFFFIYHLVTLVMPIFLIAIGIFSTIEETLHYYDINEYDFILGSVVILLYDILLITSTVVFHKMRLFKSKSNYLSTYYLFNKKSYVLIFSLLVISYLSKIYLMSIGAWFYYESVDLSTYGFANTAFFLQKIDIAVLLYFAYERKYTKLKNWKDNVIIIVATILSLAFAVLSTSKFNIVMSIIPILIMLFRQKTIAVTLVVLALILLQTFFSYSNLLRNTQNAGGTTEFFPAQEINSESNLIERRLNYQFVVAKVVKKYDIDEFDYKSDYLDNFIALVPRFLWPSKPKIGADGNSIGRELGLIGENNYHTSIGVSPIGEAFHQLWYFGIIIIPVLTAFFLYVVMMYFNKNYLIGYVLQILLGIMITVSDSYTTILPNSIKYFILFYFILFLLNRRYNDEIRIKGIKL